MDKSSTSMKEVLDYIGCKFSYIEDILQPLNKKIRTRVPLATRPNRTKANRELSIYNKCVWEK